jgi:hypothetical protein
MDLAKLAKYHAGIYRSHDEKKWNELKTNFAGLLSTSGYDAYKSRTAAKHLVKGYKYADLAFEKQTEPPNKEENALYDAMLKEFEIAYAEVGANIKPLKYKRIWYQEFRHKNSMMLLNYLREQIAIFGIFKLNLALHVTWLALNKIYPAHREHDWKTLTRVLTEYWTIVSKSYEAGMMPIEF